MSLKGEGVKIFLGHSFLPNKGFPKFNVRSMQPPLWGLLHCSAVQCVGSLGNWAANWKIPLARQTQLCPLFPNHVSYFTILAILWGSWSTFPPPNEAFLLKVWQSSNIKVCRMTLTPRGQNRRWASAAQRWVVIIWGCKCDKGYNCWIGDVQWHIYRHITYSKCGSLIFDALSQV